MGKETTKLKLNEMNIKQELQDATKELEGQILKAVQQFEIKTGLPVEAIEFDRDDKESIKISTIIDTSELW
tara:strand:- start:13862 stop:14074 length:213 start_codon:yes stop_codon:yes gene_type:complete